MATHVRLVVRRYVVVGGMFAFLFVSVWSHAQTRPSLGGPRSAFDLTDLNADERIDRGEYHRRMTELFFFLDVDKDSRLSPAELGEVDMHVFKAADRDGDGFLSLYEYLNSRFQDFEVLDKDHDGTLTRDEIQGR